MHKQQGLGSIILIVLLVVGLVAGGFIYHQIQKNPPATPNTIVPLADPTKDWEVLKDKENGFSFKYPQEADITTGINAPAKVTIMGETQEENTELTDGLALIFEYSTTATEEGETVVAGEETETERTLTDVIEADIKASEEAAEITKPLESITIAGIKGFTYSAKGLGVSQYIYLPRGATAKYIKITNSSSENYQEKANQILSTFRFD